jgi:hypothetical protein
VSLEELKGSPKKVVEGVGGMLLQVDILLYIRGNLIGELLEVIGVSLF